jgi:hypothetical protein
MAGAIKPSARQGLAFTATLVTVLSYCASVGTASFRDERVAADKTVRTDSTRTESDESQADRFSYVRVRIERPERLTNFRITLDEDGELTELAYIEPPVATPFRVRIKPAYAWHDDFLNALETELARFIEESSPDYANAVWSILCYESDPNASFHALYKRFSWMLDRVNLRLRILHPATEDDDGFGLKNGSPSSLSVAGLVVWERLRRRLITNRSIVSATLTKKGIAHTFA